MKAYVKGLVIGFVSVLVVSGIIFMAHKDGFFDLKKLDFQIVDSSSITNSPIVDLFYASSMQKLKPIEGKSLFSIDLDDVKQSFLKEEWVDTVSVRRVYPNSLKLDVKAKKWDAYWYDGTKFYPYTEGGLLLSAIPVLNGPDLPVIRLKKKSFLENKKYIAKVLKYLPKEGLLSHKTLQTVSKDKEGIYLQILPNQMKVRLGDEELDLRIGRSEKVLKYLQERELQGLVINSDFTQKVVVKLKKAK